MANKHLIKWGRHAFEKEISLNNIENYLLRRGLKKHDALKALHEITSFEHEIRQESKNIRKLFIIIPTLILLITSITFLYFAGFIK